MPDHIGQWATTPRSTRWHLIESEIGLDVVTRCGRRLRDPNKSPIRTRDTPLLLCAYCNRDRDRFEAPTLDTRGPDDR